MSYTFSGNTIYLDANIFIYMLEGYAEFIPALTQLFDLIDAGKLRAVTSELTLAETLVKPMADKNLPLQQLYQSALQPSGVLHVAPITRDILIQAARLRAERITAANTIRLPDSIHLATAKINHCHTFLTNDKRLKDISGIDVTFLSQIKSLTFAYS